MKLPRVRFTVRRLMLGVAVFAPIAAIGVRVYAACRTTGHPVAILSAVLVTGLVGLLALRKPLVAIPLVLLTYFLTPAIATRPRVNYHDLPSPRLMHFSQARFAREAAKAADPRVSGQPGFPRPLEKLSMVGASAPTFGARYARRQAENGGGSGSPKSAPVELTGSHARMGCLRPIGFGPQTYP